MVWLGWQDFGASHCSSVRIGLAWMGNKITAAVSQPDAAAVILVNTHNTFVGSSLIGCSDFSRTRLKSLNNSILIGTDFLVFDHNEFKRACCRNESQNGLWISVKEYDLKTKKWKTLEEGRYIENADDIAAVLQMDYAYDKVKFYHAIEHPQ